MIMLYQDPKGEQVGTTITTVTTQIGSGTVRIQELESKVASLEKLITELRNGE